MDTTVEDIRIEVEGTSFPQTAYEVVVEDIDGEMIPVRGFRWDHDENKLVIETS